MIIIIQKQVSDHNDYMFIWDWKPEFGSWKRDIGKLTIQFFGYSSLLLAKISFKLTYSSCTM